MNTRSKSSNDSFYNWQITSQAKDKTRIHLLTDWQLVIYENIIQIQSLEFHLVESTEFTIFITN